MPAEPALSFAVQGKTLMSPGSLSALSHASSFLCAGAGTSARLPVLPHAASLTTGVLSDHHNGGMGRGSPSFRQRSPTGSLTELQFSVWNPTGLDEDQVLNYGLKMKNNERFLKQPVGTALVPVGNLCSEKAQAGTPSLGGLWESTQWLSSITSR